MKLVVVYLGIECWLLSRLPGLPDIGPEVMSWLLRPSCRYLDLLFFPFMNGMYLHWINDMSRERNGGQQWPIDVVMEISHLDIPEWTGWRHASIRRDSAYFTFTFHAYWRRFSLHTSSRRFEELQIDPTFHDHPEMVHESRNWPRIGLTLHVLDKTSKTMDLSLMAKLIT